MDAPSPRYILTRALFLIAVVVALMYGWSFFKVYQRKTAITRELRSITSDSSFFQQFYAEDAKKTLIRAIGLIAESNRLGVLPETAIDRGLGVDAKLFATDSDLQEPPPRLTIIRSCLRTNYENFLKLGYTGEFQTLIDMKEGTLPPIPAGPDQGKRAVIGTLIDPAHSPGIDKVLANLEIRPPGSETRPPSDIETAAAKRLARELAHAGVIEEKVREKIEAKLSEPKSSEPAKK